MTKQEIVARVSDKAGLTQVQAVQAVEETLNSIITSLAKGRRVELRNFGVFEVRHRKPRIGRNPAHPERQYPVPARAVAKFKPGKEMKAEVGKLAAKQPAPPAT